MPDDKAHAFEFELIFSLGSMTSDAIPVINTLFEAGFDDALIGAGKPGSIAISCTLEGTDGDALLDEAVGKALAALPSGAALEEVRPDLVSIEELLRQIGLSADALIGVELPAPAASGRYPVADLHAALGTQAGKISECVNQELAWFNAAPIARRRNAALPGMANTFT